jgi:replicative DNA helicase Mcm
VSSSDSYPGRDESAGLLDRLGEFLGDYYHQAILKLAQRYPSEQRSLTIEYQDIWRFDPELADDLLAQPEEVLEYFDEALAQYDLPIDVGFSEARVRVVGLPDESTHDVGQYRPNDVVNTLVGVRGQVTKRSKRQLRISEAAFECQRCGVINRVPQVTEDLQEPHECNGCERQGPFVLEDSKSTISDHQLIRLQTLPENAQGTTTDTIDITLSEDLVGEVRPGDRVAANSTIESSLVADSKPILELHGQAKSLDRLEVDHEDIDVGPYREEIERVAADDPYAKLIESIAPSHKGDELIKEALAYQLFGGVGTDLPDGSSKRGTCHVLLIGDPGTGKSSLIRSASELVPRSVYASGKQSTSAGLTAAAVQSDFGGSGEWSLEAGALVESHGGLACIDELDKMDSSDQSGMLECMSEQQISISKAGINATLPASTTILAAANPEDGRFDTYSSIAGQVGLNPVLLSRFDLMFTLADDPDEEHDREIAEHMNATARAGQQLASGESVSEDLSESVTPTLEPDLIRAYVAHARTIMPELTDEAAALIEDEYVSMRMANGTEDDGPIPTTAREVEAVQRLAEASARIRLSERVETDDVERVLRVWRACLADLGMDPETGKFDADRIETGRTKTQRERNREVREIVASLEDEAVHGAPHELVIESAIEAGHSDSKVEHEIEKLMDQGELYEPATDHYRTT